MATIHELAQEMLDNMVWSKRKDGKEYVHTKKTISWQQDVIREVHGDKMPDDTTYAYIWDALNIIVENPDASEDELRHEIEEPDVYTSDLTAWLHERNDHIEYLDRAIDEFNPKDGFAALQIAQALHKQEIANSLLNELASMAD